MPRYAFYDPATGVLKAHGFVETNEPGDIRVGVPDDFGLKPGTVSLSEDKKSTLPYTAPALPPEVPIVKLKATQKLADAIAAALGDPLVPDTVKAILVELAS